MSTENFRPINRNENNTCVHVDESEQVKTEKTPYRKNFCIKCSAWTFTDKNPMQLSFGKKHDPVKNHIHTKRIMNEIVENNEMLLKNYDQIPEKLHDELYVETEFMNRRYHIPIKYVKLWSNNTKRGEVILEILDKLTTVRH